MRYLNVLILSYVTVYAILLIQIFASFRPLRAQTSVARSNFVLLTHQICNILPHRKLERTKNLHNKMVYWTFMRDETADGTCK